MKDQRCIVQCQSSLAYLGPDAWVDDIRQAQRYDSPAAAFLDAGQCAPGGFNVLPA